MSLKSIVRPFYIGLRNPLLIKPIFYDFLGIKNKIHQKNIHIRAAMNWLLLSQNINTDGGSSAQYQVSGWLASYPETSGYIIPTLIKYGKINNTNLLPEAIKMADFLIEMQLENGSFPGGSGIGEETHPTVFNTGQILFGLCSIYSETKSKKYLDAAIKAGDWLCSTQDADGCWRTNLSPYADNIPHSYNVRAAWSLLELNKICPSSKYVDANTKNVEWVLKNKNENNWFSNNSFFQGKSPFTHNIGYTMRGILESGILSKNTLYIEEIKKSIDSIIDNAECNGSYKATLDHSWKSSVNYSCLTGNIQFAIIMGKLYRIYKDERYLSEMIKINNFHKRLQFTTGNKNIKGAIKGSHPFWGGYCPYSYPNWATKFFIDSLMLEKTLVEK